MRKDRIAIRGECHKLEGWLQDQDSRVSPAERILIEIKSFLEDIQGLDIRVQKAHLQTILGAAYVHWDGRIEVEFRG